MKQPFLQEPIFLDGELSVKIERLNYKDNLITLWKKLAKPEE